MGLYSAVVLDEQFYLLAQEGATLKVDKTAKTLTFSESGKSFSFSHSVIEETLLEAGGVLPLYEQYGKGLFREMVKPTGRRSPAPVQSFEAIVNPFREPENTIRQQTVW